jgi:phage/plasmid-associated DNA primase
LSARVLCQSPSPCCSRFARFMRQDWFTYSPQFKLFFVGKRKPGLRAVNEAIRRRVNLLPFNGYTGRRARQGPARQTKIRMGRHPRLDD